MSIWEVSNTTLFGYVLPQTAINLNFDLSIISSLANKTPQKIEDALLPAELLQDIRNSIKYIHHKRFEILKDTDIQWNLPNPTCIIRKYLDPTKFVYTNERFTIHLTFPIGLFSYPNECRIVQVPLHCRKPFSIFTPRLQ